MTTTARAYTYRAVNAAGRRERGTVEAENPAELTRTLEARGLIVLDVDPEAASSDRPSTSSRGGGRRADVLELTRAMAALLAAGVPLARALSTVTAITHGATTGAVDDVRSRIARGDSLTAAIACHPRLFSTLYVGVVRAGERSGKLAGSFEALATQLEREERLRSRLLSAAIYPLILIVASLAAVAVLVLFVLPGFAELLESTRATLPSSTATLLAVADAVRGNWPAIVAVIGLAVAAVSIGVRTEAGRRAGAGLILRAPIAGTLRRYTLAARFSRVLGVLLAGGAPLLIALDDALQSLADPLARDEISRIRARVRDGMALNAAIATGTLFPPLLARLVAVGEEASRLEEFLTRTADICEDKAERLLQRLVAIAEPAMIIGLGGLVAFVALSLLQAIYGVDAAAFR